METPERQEEGLMHRPMSRRTALRILGGAAVAGVLNSVPACNTVAEILGTRKKLLSVEEQRARIAELNRDKTPGEEIPWNNKRIVQNLTEGLDDSEARTKLYEFVQSFPYRLRSFQPAGGTELYDEENGDCRHKRSAFYDLLRKRGFNVRRLDVLFDWKDLPIPADILAIKKSSGTRAFHDALEIEIGGKWIYVDPTWDPVLKAAGFPVTTDWDGVSPTREITNGKTEKISEGRYGSFGDYLTAYGVPWPVRSETDEFNRRLNEWLEQQRHK